MKLSVFSEAFIEDVRKYVEKELNYEYSWNQKKMVRKRDRSQNEFSQVELPFVVVAEILDFEDFTYYGGYCETCSYEDTYCRITYRTLEGETRTYEYTDSFADLINALVKD